MAHESQIKAFEEAKSAVQAELCSEMRDWTFEVMLERLARAIRVNVPPERKNKRTRYFCRHFLNLHGERHQRIRGAILKTCEISVNEIKAVLIGLNKLIAIPIPASVQTQVQTPKKVSVPKVKTTLCALTPVPKKVDDVRRKIIDHTISSLNSLAGLVTECKLTPAEVLDGDRMRVSDSLEKISKALGIDVQFPHTNGDALTPLTAEDMKEIGLTGKGKD